MNKKYKRILIANRGDSAVRVIRACKEMGIETVSVYSKCDKGSFHARLADYSVCIGDVQCKDSYLNAYNILTAATNYKVDAIHPGIGYFAENADFSELCKHCDIDYIGPGSSNISLMGNKAKAKKVAKECDIPVIGDDSVEINNYEECLQYAGKIGYPIILKAVNGGGGKGIRLVYREEELLQAVEQCLKEAEKVFGSGSILVESYISHAKHIEVQVLADQYGNVIHLGDRECTIQRKNQKLIEESRCTTLSEETRNRMYQGAIDLCRHIGYVGVGTIEYLLKDDKSFYFMEMNTRLQVEHTITEMITGIDLVKEQIRVAQGEPLKLMQEEIMFQGYAIQCRILAEYYNGAFIPDYGKISRYDMPGGFGVRVDSSYEVNNIVTTYYDSLLCKICCHDKDKVQAVNKMLRCLEEMQLEGVLTNKEILISILNNPRFLTGDYTTTFLDTLKNYKKD
ncbi:biotin carboxylase N-terminal domain-containing protein [Clostridium boliviensis]|uniref:biotin carboxylase n=1 Tax=Clostridium boliviensis TaxID=318465 RepID=A0ABU4GSR3_9CLOT|nr:biotin carboxylase N-terminal domain-containing protein [Clostridium boliviensis]MDW2800673.1 biotin carboxylase N-terminal domain-containing protein [Clostridium boliviensis]